MKKEKVKASRKAPAKPILLEVGKTYITRNGLRTVKIVRNDGNSFPMHGEWEIKGCLTTNFWRRNGTFGIMDSSHYYDLIREVPAPQRGRAKG